MFYCQALHCGFVAGTVYMSEAGDFSADILHLFCVLALGQQAEQNCLSALFSDSMFSGTLIHTVTLTLVRRGLL